MTSTVLARGSRWSAATLYDSSAWGSDTTDDQATALADLVVERFHGLARQAGSSAAWSPATSEVVGDVDDPSTGELLVVWRERAMADVWAAVTDESSDVALSHQVLAIFGRRFVVEAVGGAPDGGDRDLLVIRDLDLEADGEARVGRLVVYASEVDDLIADILAAAQQLGRS